MPLERNIPLSKAAKHFHLSVDTLRKFIRGQNARGKHLEFEPILEEGIHWFRQGKGQNSPYILRIEPTEQTLAEHGYWDPATKEEQ